LSNPRAEVYNVAHLADVRWELLELVGYSLEGETFRPGDNLPLTLLWCVNGKMGEDYAGRVWLEDAREQRFSAREFRLDAAGWQSGQLVRVYPRVALEANTPDGEYRVWMEMTRAGAGVGQINLGVMTVKGRAHNFTAPVVAKARGDVFDDKMKLTGYDWDGARLTLVWQALAPMDTAYTVFVHLLDAQGNVVAAGDAVPGGGEFPTTSWVANEFIRDAHTLAVAAGKYQIEIGVYDATTGMRLKTAEGQDHLILETVEVR
jgi:hypothetical protein